MTSAPGAPPDGGRRGPLRTEPAASGSRSSWRSSPASRPPPAATSPPASRHPADGIGRELALAFNRLVESNAGMERELARVRRTVGRDGLISERATPPVASGAWQRSVDSLNSLIDDLVRPTTEFARVIEAVAKGDLSERMPARIEGHPVRGEFSRIRATVNLMVERLSSFAGEVTRVAREVGTEGKLGGQAQVKGVSGTWRDLTDSVNSMASNLTDQVRNIAEVTTAVADGDLSRKITVDVRGEVLQLKDTINTMVDQLRSFADEVTRVAREVGTEGKLGGQAADERRVRRLEGPDRQRQHPRRQPHQPGAQHRAGDHRRGPRRPVPEDHRGRPRRGRWSSRTPSTRWWTSCARSRRR